MVEVLRFLSKMMLYGYLYFLRPVDKKLWFHRKYCVGMPWLSQRIIAANKCLMISLFTFVYSFRPRHADRLPHISCRTAMAPDGASPNIES